MKAENATKNENFTSAKNVTTAKNVTNRTITLFVLQPCHKPSYPENYNYDDENPFVDFFAAQFSISREEFESNKKFSR